MFLGRETELGESDEIQSKHYLPELQPRMQEFA